MYNYWSQTGSVYIHTWKRIDNENGLKEQKQNKVEICWENGTGFTHTNDQY
jgi:hypothetical protein